jgi:hypothetical protein
LPGIRDNPVSLLRRDVGNTFPLTHNDGREWAAGGCVILIKFKTQVVPNDTALKVAVRNGERHFVFVRLEQSRVESQSPLLPKTLVGVVTNRVGGSQPGVVWASAVTDGSALWPLTVTAS